jgi:hypothetical protein
MYIKVSKHSQLDLIKEAIEKAGTIRKISKILKIPKSSIHRYQNSETIPKDRFKQIIKFLEKNIKEIKTEDLENNWKQKLGGKNCVTAKKRNGTYKKDLKKAQISGTKKLKKWHQMMKITQPRKYYKLQYSKFKKISGYKHKTNKGEKVKNILEKQIADILYKLNIDYEYEPLIEAGGKYFFPDFLINKKIIIECTSWKGETKAYKLKERIEHLKKDYKVFIVIPKNLYSYYRILDNYLVKSIEEFVPIAQTFLICKK